jgi:hypothetical protein
MSRSIDEQHFVRGVRTSIANNTSAYGFSLTVAGSYASLAKVHGDPSWVELFLFLVGSCVGFATVNAVSTRLFRKESPDEPELVITLGDLPERVLGLRRGRSRQRRRLRALELAGLAACGPRVHGRIRDRRRRRSFDRRAAASARRPQKLRGARWEAERQYP